eukprot:TRINITY_DN6692_c0_g1_i6.p1 TRINITY_DN6692_c0_g1~~TRINITY_DN6692_c0_g1_i6.p1  ORF type:complete len:615 (-),score=153.96 TRINITY_DN6692_c0_g1_i6:314-2158(-)
MVSMSNQEQSSTPEMENALITLVVDFLQSRGFNWTEATLYDELEKSPGKVFRRCRLETILTDTLSPQQNDDSDTSSQYSDGGSSGNRDHRSSEDVSAEDGSSVSDDEDDLSRRVSIATDAEQDITERGDHTWRDDSVAESPFEHTPRTHRADGSNPAEEEASSDSDEWENDSDDGYFRMIVTQAELTAAGSDDEFTDSEEGESILGAVEASSEGSEQDEELLDIERLEEQPANVVDAQEDEHGEGAEAVLQHVGVQENSNGGTGCGWFVLCEQGFYPAVPPPVPLDDRSPTPTDEPAAEEEHAAQEEGSESAVSGAPHFNLKVYYEPNKTGFEATKKFPTTVGSVIAGRYQITDVLGSAAFSTAVQCLDLKRDELVCVKIIKNSKDFFDQSLDEIKLLQYINNAGDPDEHRVLELYDYFYFKEHLFLVTELLRDNLYEFQRFNRNNNSEKYFTLPRLQMVTKQILEALAFVHDLGMIHCDLKPENILIKSYSRSEVKVIDFGSSCFITDKLTSYVQSRSYRAPEVLLGCLYGRRVDIWSLGCIVAELWTGLVLFQSDSIPALLARIVSVLGPIPMEMIDDGRYVDRYLTRNQTVYEKCDTDRRDKCVPGAYLQL